MVSLKECHEKSINGPFEREKRNVLDFCTRARGLLPYSVPISYLTQQTYQSVHRIAISGLPNMIFRSKYFLDYYLALCIEIYISDPIHFAHLRSAALRFIVLSGWPKTKIMYVFAFFALSLGPQLLETGHSCGLTSILIKNRIWISINRAWVCVTWWLDDFPVEYIFFYAIAWWRFFSDRNGKSDFSFITTTQYLLNGYVIRS